MTNVFLSSISPPSSCATKEKATRVLESVIKIVPGHIEAQLKLAKAKFITNRFEEALSAVQHCLSLEPAFAEAHILVAMIYLAQEKFTVRVVIEAASDEISN